MCSPQVVDLSGLHKDVTTTRSHVPYAPPREHTYLRLIWTKVSDGLYAYKTCLDKILTKNWPTNSLEVPKETIHCLAPGLSCWWCSTHVIEKFVKAAWSSVSMILVHGLLVQETRCLVVLDVAKYFSLGYWLVLISSYSGCPTHSRYFAMEIIHTSPISTLWAIPLGCSLEGNETCATPCAVH